MKDYYKILGVKPTATETEIKKKFRQLASIHHPDKNSGSKSSEETFKEIANAYYILSCKDKRANYDQIFQHSNRYNWAENISHNKQSQQKASSSPKQQRRKSNYSFLIILILILVVYLTSKINKLSTMGDSKVNKELKKQDEKRPESGELNF